MQSSSSRTRAAEVRPEQRRLILSAKMLNNYWCAQGVGSGAGVWLRPMFFHMRLHTPLRTGPRATNAFHKLRVRGFCS